MKSIPIHKIFSDFSQTIELDGEIFQFRYKWNTRGEFWALDIYTSEGVSVLLGAKLVINSELITDYADSRLPKGALIPTDVTQTLSRIGRSDLGDKVQFLYLTKEEVEQLDAI